MVNGTRPKKTKGLNKLGVNYSKIIITIANFYTAYFPGVMRWQPIRILPRESWHGQRILVAYSQWGCKEMIALSTYTSPTLWQVLI